MSLSPPPSLHAEALAWLRYSKQMPIVVTESVKQADVLGINAVTAIEVEIKVSIADLRAEFRNKTVKHMVYREVAADSKIGPYTYCPNFWYLFVDQALAEKTLEIAAEFAPYAGILVRNAPARNAYGAGKYNCYVARKATRLHKNPPRPQFIRAAIMRMASEICGWHLLSGKKLVGVPVDEVKTAIARQLHAVEATLDHEDPGPNLEQRGRELAWVMTRRTWDRFSSVDKMVWCLQAQQLLSLRRGPEEIVDDAEIC